MAELGFSSHPSPKTVNPMTRHTLNWMALFAVAALALPGVAAAAPGMEKNGVLVDSAGMTLYTFDKDAGGKSMCNPSVMAQSIPLQIVSLVLGFRPAGFLMCGDVWRKR